MVKVDVRRDYYADLGLQPSAEAEDIKKQFRKLALKFHPDRNQGHEQEVIAKFQAIQAAHEVLSDSQQRLKYDTERLRAGYGKLYGPTKNAARSKPQPSYQKTYSPTPPKPQATSASSSNRPQATSSGPSAGAARYASHARAGHEQWQKPQDQSQTRADAYKGFHNMRGQNWRGFDPTSGATPRQQNTPFGHQKAKSAYEYFKESAQAKNATQNTANSPRKRNGYAPGTAAGDEPMAAGTSAYNSTRIDRPSSMYFDSAPPPTAKKPMKPVDPSWQPESARAPSPPLAQEFERTSRSYASVGGEKTFFASPGLGRSSTTRTPPASQRTSDFRDNPLGSDRNQHGRHRSASPKARSYSYSSTSSELDDDTTEEDVRRPSSFKPMAVPKSRLRSARTSNINPTSSSNLGTGETYSSRSAHQARRSSSSTQSRRAPTYIDLTTESDDPQGHNSDSSAFAKGTATSQPQNLNESSDASHMQPNPTPSGHTGANNLHKKFSADDWRQHLSELNFLGAKLKEQAALNKKSPLHSNGRPRANTRDSPKQSSTAAGFGVDSTGSTAKAGFFETQPRQSPTPFAQPRFLADKWSKDLHNISWTAAEKSGQSDSASSSRSPNKSTGMGSKVRSTPKPVQVASDIEEAARTVNFDGLGQKGSPILVDDEPMDLDEVVPIPSTSNLAERAVRHSGCNRKSTPQGAPGGVTSQPIFRSPLFDLGNFGNTAPFTSTNSSGIENLGDVSATLPFESQAKVQRTTTEDIRPRALQLPNPPKRPKVPTLVPAAIGSQKLVLSRDQWNYYVSAMGTYLHEWNLFNRRMLLHFNTRQDAVETGLAPGWISAVGDTIRLRINEADNDSQPQQSTTGDESGPIEADEYLVPGSGKGGFSAYLRGIEEDILVRKHWEVACELHRESIVELGRLREWIRKGGTVV
ncbi:hypothetical protein N7539_002933 [Penicillium diatomitis]|uniref:J domain-containing protein n=1 Tax=Penicillium diatomitis TaxID=2819901 RepID=A0A9X0BZ61_9EURO|nr:uncharacterized protein N7539_002933 [Penicillium diatomitis]KAJ5491366.1 hypothetical protein N7539_002933 [Penicillium diatomitis]